MKHLASSLAIAALLFSAAAHATAPVDNGVRMAAVQSSTPAPAAPSGPAAANPYSIQGSPNVAMDAPTVKLPSYTSTPAPIMAANPAPTPSAAATSVRNTPAPVSAIATVIAPSGAASAASVVSSGLSALIPAVNNKYVCSLSASNKVMEVLEKCISMCNGSYTSNPANLTFTCNAGKDAPVSNNGGCPDGAANRGGRCAYENDPTPKPPANPVACGTGMINMGGTCVPVMPGVNGGNNPTRVNCRQDQISTNNGTACECKAPTVEEGNRCVSRFNTGNSFSTIIPQPTPTPANNCPAGQKLSNGTCEKVANNSSGTVASNNNGNVASNNSGNKPIELDQVTCTITGTTVKGNSLNGTTVDIVTSTTVSISGNKISPKVFKIGAGVEFGGRDAGSSPCEKTQIKLALTYCPASTATSKTSKEYKGCVDVTPAGSR